MGAIASQITSLTTAYSTVYSDADQRKHQSSASLAFVRGIHRGPMNSPHKWPVTRKMFPFDDVIVAQTYWFYVTTVLLRIASYRHRVASFCTAVHRVISCWIRVEFVLVRKWLSYHIVPILSWGRTDTHPRFLSKKSHPFSNDVTHIDSQNYAPQTDWAISNITGKRIDGIPYNCQEWSYIEQGTFWTRFDIFYEICMQETLECGTWYHHPRRLQCVLSRNQGRTQRDIIDAVTTSKIIVFEMICNIAYYSAAKFTFPIEQPSIKATTCGIRRSWKLKWNWSMVAVATEL